MGLIRDHPGELGQHAGHHRRPVLLVNQEADVGAQLVQARAQLGALLRGVLGGRDLALEIGHDRPLLLQRDRERERRESQRDQGEPTVQPARRRRLGRLGRQQVERRRLALIRVGGSGRASSTRDGVTLQAAAAASACSTTARGATCSSTVMRRRSGSRREDAAREDHVLGAERGQAVHLEAQQLIEVVLGGERQIQDLAQAHPGGEAERDPASPAARRAQQRRDLGRLAGLARRDLAERLLVLADDIGHADAIGAQGKDQAMPVAAPGRAEARRDQALELAEPPGEEPSEAALDEAKQASHGEPSPRRRQPGHRGGRPPRRSEGLTIDHGPDDQVWPAPGIPVRKTSWTRTRSGGDG